MEKEFNLKKETALAVSALLIIIGVFTALFLIF